MEFMVITVSAFIFVLVLLCFSDALKRHGIKQKHMRELKNEGSYLDQELEKDLYQRFIGPVLDKIKKRLARFNRQNRKAETGRYAKLQNELSAAGIGVAAGTFIMARLAFNILFLAAALCISLFVRAEGSLTLMMLTFFLILSVLIPRYYVRAKARSRRQAISNQLPNIMDMMSVSIEAGLGFDASMLSVTDYFKGPLSDELLRVQKEVQMGIPRKEALTSLSLRTNVDELKTFASAVIQSERYGTPVINVLREQAQELRILRRQKAQEAASKAPVKMLLPMVMFIFPVLFIILLGPAALDIAAMFRNLE